MELCGLSFYKQGGAAVAAAGAAACCPVTPQRLHAVSSGPDVALRLYTPPRHPANQSTANRCMPGACSLLARTPVCAAFPIHPLTHPHAPHRFPGDEIPIVRGSALCALKGENEKIGK